ncbi:MAG: RsmB/NOP family class I SAM-dependent RNA methyltransferase [Erysipelotrichaceae bacterium]|nr:RsmB/NOP family class I SAM-dependent RNA methyltransferase [Erysipelotrichaceae bacterium]MDD3810365.1 RsmB/NOP family class I SAM-dependent RNA methyltransferase [Erysipelotrichaceae bacterium]
MAIELFYQRMADILKEEYPQFEKALEQHESKGFYLNTLKSDILEHLDHARIRPHEFIANGYRYDHLDYFLGKHPYFDLGLYYIQDPAAMIVANTVAIQADDYVLDMCGAPGGKSCKIAMELSGDGLLVANDISPLRARILSGNIERMGITNTIVTNGDPVNFTRDLSGFFDKVFLDAPCSGEGMFRKTDKAIETWSPEKVAECAAIQRKLLDSAFELLKPDGLLVYSTCTYSLEENEDQVRYMLENYPMELVPVKLHPGMTSGIFLEGTVRMYPHKYQGEGQFIAILKKIEGKKTKAEPLKDNVAKAQRELVSQFYKENLNIPTPKQLFNSNGHIYAIQPNFVRLSNFKILRNGLHLGECKKNRFEPSHSLARTLTKDQVRRFVDFPVDSKEFTDYLAGLTLPAVGNRGYGVIFGDGYPLSFYKESDMIKNLYPKGLRR